VEDSSGNVWEWCRTKFEEGYDGYRDDNDLEGDDPRVLRGGAFFYRRRLVRCAFRYRFDPDDRNDYVGFRLVMVSPSTLDSERSEL
jgi:formylglycine-generating enzyme required for sulfatase activity